MSCSPSLGNRPEAVHQSGQLLRVGLKKAPAFNPGQSPLGLLFMNIFQNIPFLNAERAIS